MKLTSVLRYWSRGVRFYIAISIILFTLESWGWAEATHGGTLLFATRLEELYAWVAIGLLTVAVSIGPICTIWPKVPIKHLLFDARRLIGIGAIWFSALHVIITYASLFKFANPLTLPGTYQRAFAVGVVASLILLAMAFTSFDKAFNAMGKWWFRLHRLVYIAVILSLFHAFLIGTHATGTAELVILTVAAIFMLSLHTYLAFWRRRPATVWQTVAIPPIAVLLIAVLAFGYSQRLGYHPLKGRLDNPSHETLKTKRY